MTKILALNKKKKIWIVEVEERRSINCKGNKRGPIPCGMFGCGYLPDYMKKLKDKALNPKIGGSLRMNWEACLNE